MIERKKICIIYTGGTIVMLACRLFCMLPALVWGTGILPLNVLTPLFGAPVVLWVLLRKV